MIASAHMERYVMTIKLLAKQNLLKQLGNAKSVALDAVVCSVILGHRKGT
jgi:hypothetical protein